MLSTPPSQSTYYGENPIKSEATSNWNLLQRITNVDLLRCDFHEFKKQSVTSIMPTTNNLT